MEIIYNLGNKTVLYSNVITARRVLTRTANGPNKRLVLHVRISYGSLSITTPVSLLANEFDGQSVLHRQVSLTAVNHRLNIIVLEGL